MKKYILIALIGLGLGLSVSAQVLSFGIKGGLNYSKMKFDEIKNISAASVNYNIMEDESFQGFHIGVMGRLKVFNLFLQPELLFNTTGGKVLVENMGTSFKEVKTIKYNKLDLPVLLGMKIGPARINVGPVASVTLSSNSELQEFIPNLETLSKGATIGFQAGAGIDILKKFSIDLRYEGGLSKLGDKLTVGGNSYAFDSRDRKFLVSLGFFF